MRFVSTTRITLSTLSSLTGLLFSHLLTAQNMSPNQVWLMPLMNNQPGEPRLISQATRYNNQPHFSAGSRVIYFTAEQEDGQTDIWQYDISSGNRSAVIQSPESEFSPTPIPGRNAVSVIRIEADQRQRLWSIDLNSSETTLLMPNVEPVGYHAWISEDIAALFILGDTMTLHKSKTGNSPSVQLTENIGRTLRRHPENGTALYVDKTMEPWWIAAIDLNSKEKARIIPLLPTVEDFEVDFSSRFWAGTGSEIYRSDPHNTQWELIFDIKSYGLDNVSRLAVSPNGAWLAIVVSP